MVLPHDWSGLSGGRLKAIGHIRSVRDSLDTFQIPTKVWDQCPHIYNFHPN